MYYTLVCLGIVQSQYNTAQYLIQIMVVLCSIYWIHNTFYPPENPQIVAINYNG